jgi:hypothetical protein
MRSTRAVGAVERLKARSGMAGYTMMVLPQGLFHLALRDASGVPQKVGKPLPLDEFVKFVDAFGPPKPQRISKLDVEFEKQLRKK